MSKLTELIEELCPDGVDYKPLISIVGDGLLTDGDWVESKDQDPDGAVRLTQLADVGVTRFLDRSDRWMTQKAAGRLGCTFLQPNDVLIARMPDPIGRACLVPADIGQAVTVVDVAILRPDAARADARFLNYAINSYSVHRQILALQTGGTRKRISRKNLEKVLVPHPPLEVQQEIVRVLDAFTDLEQNLVAELNLRKKQFEFYRGQLFHFDHSVEWSTLGDVSLKVTSGGTPSSKNTSYYGGDIPWLRTQEVNFEDIYSTGISITEEGLNNSSAKWIPANCVIVAMYGATAAKSAINAIPLTTNQACCNLQIDPSLAEYRFVYYWVSHMYENLKRLGEGSQSNLNAKKVKNFPIPVPPLETQREIIDKLCEFESLIQSIEQEISLRRKQYEFYRDELLSFAGKEA